MKINQFVEKVQMEKDATVREEVLIAIPHIPPVFYMTLSLNLRVYAGFQTTHRNSKAMPPRDVNFQSGGWKRNGMYR